MTEGGGHVAINITHELLALRNKRQQTAETLPCIVRVPEILKKQSRENYVPEVVGLGAYHHDFNLNLNIRSHKLKALDRALGRSLSHLDSEATDADVENLLQQLRGFVSSFENEIKACYSEDFKFDADVFMLDAVFLLELCFSYRQRKASDRFHLLLDYRTLGTCVGTAIQRDLFKLENQILLPLLRELINWKGMFLLPGNNPCDFDFDLMVDLFPIKQGDKNLWQMMEEEPRPKHLIACLHRCTVKSLRRQCSNENESSKPTSAGNSPGESHRRRRNSSSRFWKRWGERFGKYCAGKSKEKPDEEDDDDYWVIPRAEELERVGIFVQVSHDNKLCFKQGRFKLRGHLYLPWLELQDGSEVALRNMIVYEECCVEPGQRFFNRYMSLMTDLLQTERDAALLIRRGIIRNLFGNDEQIAQFFNGPWRITLDGMDEIDSEIVKKVREYYKSSLRVMLRDFIQTYFANPWYTCATIAAVVVLVCTLVQAVYAVKFH